MPKYSPDEILTVVGELLMFDETGFRVAEALLEIAEAHGATSPNFPGLLSHLEHLVPSFDPNGLELAYGRALDIARRGGTGGTAGVTANPPPTPTSAGGGKEWPSV